MKQFNSKGKKIQFGIDPWSLKPTKDLSKLDKKRLSDAYKYGRDQAISVYRDGTIEDGHHRLANARKRNQAVDIIILY